MIKVYLHVPELPETGEYEQLLKDGKTKAKDIQKKFVKSLGKNNISCSFVTQQSHQAGKALVELALEEEAHLLVSGSRGLGANRSAIMGSVSDYLVHHAHCPVMVCRMKSVEKSGKY